MKRQGHVLLYVVAGLVLSVTLVELGVYIANLKTQRREDALLKRIENFRIGETTWDESQPIRIAYGAITDQGSTGPMPERLYSILVVNSLVNRMAFKFRRLWPLGLRPSGVELDLRYREEKLSYLRYTFFTAALSPSGRPRILTAEVRLQQRGDQPFQDHGDYHIGAGPKNSWTFGKQGETDQILVAFVTPEATDEERKAAFGFDLSCMSALGGCRALCEMMPSVWKEALRRYCQLRLKIPRCTG